MRIIGGHRAKRDVRVDGQLPLFLSENGLLKLLTKNIIAGYGNIQDPLSKSQPTTHASQRMSLVNRENRARITTDLERATMKLNLISGLLLALVATFVTAATPGATTCLIKHPNTYTPSRTSAARATSWSRLSTLSVGRIMEGVSSTSLATVCYLPSPAYQRLLHLLIFLCAGKPKQWVPRKWCTKHFMRLCARSNEQGANRRKLGRNHCQTWLTFPMG